MKGNQSPPILLWRALQLWFNKRVICPKDVIGNVLHEEEHYKISLAMGERRLFPAVRRQTADAIIAAAGTSCREQIRAGTARQAKHPAEILRDALAKKWSE